MNLQYIVDAGTAPTFAAPSLSDTVTTGSLLVVKNASGASIDVTFVIPGNLPSGDPYPDHVIAVPAADERWIRVKDAFSPYTTAAVTFSSVTSITAANIAA